MLAVLAVSLRASTLHAGNEDAYLLGNEAAMAAGAVAAVTQDTGAVWYNPAGLGGVRRSKIDVSASAFVLNIRRLPDLLVTELETETLSGGVENLSLRSVPTDLVYVRSLSSALTIGAGLFVPVSDALSERSTVGARTSFAELPGVLVDYQQRIELSWERSTYYLGGAIGWEVLPTLRIGVALFLTFRFDEERFLTLGEGHDTTDTLDQRYSVRQTDRDATVVGARATVGIQWQPHERLSLGFVLKSPQVSFYQWGRIATLTDITPGLLSSDPDGGISFNQRSLKGPGPDVVSPWRLNFAFAYHFDRGWLSAEIDVQTPLENEAFDVRRSWVANIRVGATARLSETWAIGGGLFTDLTGQGQLNSLGSWRVNFYGGTFGVELRTPIEVRDRTGHEALVFSTTVAARYAIGFGESLGYTLVPQLTGNDGFSVHLRDVLFHELSAHIGSTLLF